MSAYLQTRSNRSRNRAVATTALLIAGWIVGDQFVRYSQRDDDHSTLISPKLLVDIAEAEDNELRLLPHVGAKTSQRWLEQRDSIDFHPPNDLRELEELPQVGPKRAAELAPYLLSDESMRSDTKPLTREPGDAKQSREQNREKDF